MSFEKTLELSRKIPKGKVTSYRELSRALGNPKLAHAVGNWLNKNPHTITIPCHRVIRSDGRVGGYSGGRKKKEQLLKEEGIAVINGRINLSKYMFTF